MASLTLPSKKGDTSKKRPQYTSIACDQCRRRKTKCSGKTPCGKCLDGKVKCTYRPRKWMHMSSRKCSQRTEISEPPAETSQPLPTDLRSWKFPDLFGIMSQPLVEPSTTDSPASSTGIAVQHAVAGTGHSQRSLPSRSTLPIPQCLERIIRHKAQGSPGGVFAALETDLWLECFLIYDEEIGLEYPFLDMDELSQHMKGSTNSSDDCNTKAIHSKEGESRQSSQVEDIATLVLIIVSILVDPEVFETANPLVSEIYAPAITRGQLEIMEENELIIILLSSIFHFITDREVMAWRGIGVVLRLLYASNHPNIDRIWVKYSSGHGSNISEPLYWSAYTLDRLWSLCTGLPFAVQDLDVGRRPNLEDGSVSTAYLVHMVDFCRIAGATRDWILDFPGSSASTSKLTRDIIQSQLVEWYLNVPDQLRLHGQQDIWDPAAEGRGKYKLRLMLYLRANQMRTAIYRAWSLQFGLSTLGHSGVNCMVDIARDTIRILAGLAHTPDLHHARDKTFKNFLGTAISSLLSVISLTASLCSASYLPDIALALEVIQQLSVKSPPTISLQDNWGSLQKVTNNMEAPGRLHSHALSASTTIKTHYEHGQEIGHSGQALTGKEPCEDLLRNFEPRMNGLMSEFGSTSVDELGLAMPSSSSYMSTEPAKQRVECQALNSGFWKASTQEIPFGMPSSQNSLFSLTSPVVAAFDFAIPDGLPYAELV